MLPRTAKINKKVLYSKPKKCLNITFQKNLIKSVPVKSADCWTNLLAAEAHRGAGEVLIREEGVQRNFIV